jgi:thymidylate synthase
MLNSISLTDAEYDLIKLSRSKAARNPNYVLWDFDDNMQKVLDSGFEMMDRTGTGCKYLPGVTTSIDISKRVPIPTRRKTAWKSMLNEYLWFLTGSDKIEDLNKMGSKVWDFWRDDTWAIKNGFKPSSIGYGYGPNLINAGGDLNDLENNPGFNQIDYVLNELRTNPNSRRILFNFWRSDKVGKNDVKLNPCHVIYQFVVEPNENGEMKNLSCCVYARSTDSFVGALSTNLQGATFYTYMLAQQVGMVPSKLYFTSGHFHVYTNHIKLVEEYLGREAPNSPILTVNKKNSIYEYTAEDFTLSDYNPLPGMKVPIAV